MLKFIGNAKFQTTIATDGGNARLPDVNLGEAQTVAPLTSLAEHYGKTPNVEVRQTLATMKSDGAKIVRVQSAEGLSVKETLTAKLAARIEEEKKFLAAPTS